MVSTLLFHIVAHIVFIIINVHGFLVVVIITVFYSILSVWLVLVENKGEKLKLKNGRFYKFEVYSSGC